MKLQMLKWKLTLVLLSMIVLSSSGCFAANNTLDVSVQPTQTRAAVETIEPTNTPSVEGVQTVSPVPEKSSETAAESVTHTVLPPTPTWVPGTTQACLNIMQETSMLTLSLSGVIVVAPELFSWPVFIDLESGESHELGPLLSDGKFLTFDVSPNRRVLAVQEFGGDNHLWIVNPGGEVVKELDFDLNWSYFRWVNNEEIEIHYKAEGDIWAFNVVFINPSTGMQEQAPALQLGSPHTAFSEQPLWTTVYSPDKELVVYLLLNEGGHWDEAILWDRVLDQPVWQQKGKFLVHYVDDPSWSPSGEELAIVYDFTLHRITRAGNEIPLPLNSDEVRVQKYSWAPDGGIIAFWGFVLKENRNRLFLLDTSTNEITDTCLTTPESGAKTPLWSPDGKHLVVYVQINEDDGLVKYVRVLVDLIQETAYPLPDIERPLFWMSQESP